MQTAAFSMALAGKQRVLSAFVTLFIVIFVAVFGTGCAIKLAPDYDKAIFDGLTKINEDAMTLFASVSSGVTQNTYQKRRANYDALIGKLEAVRIQIDSRLSPIPPLFAAVILPKSVSTGTSNADASAAPVPTLGSVNTMIRTITSMRDYDSRHGLTPMLVKGFKLRFEPSIEQALVYEKALNR